MKIIAEQQIFDLNIPIHKYYDWICDCLSRKKEAILPPKISLSPSKDIFFNTMPCILPYKNVEGVKMINRIPQRVPLLKSHIVLHDFESGEVKAVIDANFITNIRTGAVTTHSIKLLAKTNYSVIGIIGLGNTCKATFDMLFAIESDKKFTIKLYKYKDQAEKFIQRYSNNKNLEFIICDTYEKVVEDSDVVVSCVTYAYEDFCDDRVFKEGCLVVPVHTRGFMNCDLFFDKVYGDDTGHVRGFKYFDKFKKFSEVADIVYGDDLGRESDSERILAYNIGLAIHDIYFADEIYNLVIENESK